MGKRDGEKKKHIHTQKQIKNKQGRSWPIPVMVMCHTLRVIHSTPAPDIQEIKREEGEFSPSTQSRRPKGEISFHRHIRSHIHSYNREFCEPAS